MADGNPCEDCKKHPVLGMDERPLIFSTVLMCRADRNVCSRTIRQTPGTPSPVMPSFFSLCPLYDDRTLR